MIPSLVSPISFQPEPNSSCDRPILSYSCYLPKNVMEQHVYAVDTKSHKAILDFVSCAPAFTVFPRDASGQVSSQYPPGDPPHVISAINTCRKMLEQERVRDAFKAIAGWYSKRRPNSWYLQGSSPMNMNQVAYTFIQKILATFPQVFVDYNLKNPDNRGFHIRRPWDGNCDPGRQAISISGRVSGTSVGCYDIRPRAS